MNLQYGSSGLSTAIIPQISESIHEIAKMGHYILLAESNIYHVPDFTDKLYVIDVLDQKGVKS